MTEQHGPARERKAKGQNVALYPDDLDRIERIRRHYGLDSFSQAVRRAVRVTTAVIAAEPSDAIDRERVA